LGGNCCSKCSSMGLKCNAEEMSTITSCDAVIDASAKAGFECKSCAGSRDWTSGSPFTMPDPGDCFFFTPGDRKASCGPAASPDHSPLCRCEKEAPEKEGCSVFSKVDAQVQRLDALIDEVEQTLANLNAAQSEFGNVDGEMVGSAAQSTKDAMIYALVLFNIGTLMGCVSCVYWQQMKGKRARVVYDEVNQLK